MIEVPLHEVAHGRAGDKGNRLNITVIPYHRAAYPVLGEQLTEAAVLRLFAYRGADRVTRYDLPKLGAYSFVIDNVLEGGVNTALNLDGHGKAMSFRLLSMPVRVDPALLAEGSPWRVRQISTEEETTP
jgi:hypothetical protein